MSEKENLTAFDELVQTRELQMLKTIVPYVNASSQNQLVMLIQLLEFRHTYQLLQQGPPQLAAASLPEGTDRRTAILNGIRPFCTPREQELIDNVTQMLILLENYENF